MADDMQVLARTWLKLKEQQNEWDREDAKEAAVQRLVEAARLSVPFLEGAAIEHFGDADYGRRVVTAAREVKAALAAFPEVAMKPDDEEQQVLQAEAEWDARERALGADREKAKAEEEGAWRRAGMGEEG